METFDEIKNPLKIGILIDADDENYGNGDAKGGIENRLKLVNKVIHDVLQQNPNFAKMCENISDFKPIQPTKLPNLNILLGCHFTNVDGKGNLDTLQKALAKKELAHIANCLEEWRKCYETKLERGIIPKNYEIKKMESDEEKLWVHFFFEKQWLDFYKKYDTLDNTERGNSGKKNDLKVLLKERGRNIFNLNLDNNYLYFQNLCNFLTSFK